jgi:hypothetical protein
VNGEFYRSNNFLPLSVDRKTSTDCYNNITGTLPGQYVKYKVAATPSCFSLQFYPYRDAELTWPAAHNALSITSHPQPPKHKHPPKKTSLTLTLPALPQPTPPAQRAKLSVPRPHVRASPADMGRNERTDHRNTNPQAGYKKKFNPPHNTIEHSGRGRQKEMDSRGIEPRTTPMLREYYTTKPRARGVELLYSMVIGRIGSDIVLAQLAMRREGVSLFECSVLGSFDGCGSVRCWVVSGVLDGALVPALGLRWSRRTSIH